MKTRSLAILLALGAIVSILTGCGQKGDLVLPPQTAFTQKI